MQATALAFVVAATALTGTMSPWAHAAQTASCEVPAAGVAELDVLPTATEETDPTPAVGSAIIQVEGEDAAAAATAVASPLATPVPPAPDPIVILTQELTALSAALAACLSAGEDETVAELAGERYLGQLFGGSVPLSAEEYVALASQITPAPTRIVALEEVARSAADRATAIVTQIVGNQLMRAEWTFEEAPSGERSAGQNPWRLAGERQLPVQAPPDSTPIGVEIGERSFTLSEEDVAGPDVVLRGINVSAEDHEMLVLRLAPGYTTADLLRATGPNLPEEVTFIGELPVPAGERGDLALVDLDPGEYTLVCLFTDEQGTPHLAQGMEAVFAVG